MVFKLKTSAAFRVTRLEKKCKSPYLLNSDFPCIIFTFFQFFLFFDYASRNNYRKFIFSFRKVLDNFFTAFFARLQNKRRWEIMLITGLVNFSVRLCNLIELWREKGLLAIFYAGKWEGYWWRRSKGDFQNNFCISSKIMGKRWNWRIKIFRGYSVGVALKDLRNLN